MSRLMPIFVTTCTSRNIVKINTRSKPLRQLTSRLAGKSLDLNLLAVRSLASFIRGAHGVGQAGHTTHSQPLWEGPDLKFGLGFD